MTSAIDPTKPTSSVAYTADVRANFAAAKTEIEELQNSTARGPFLPLTGITGLPTSPDGLNPGDLWLNGGVLCVA